MRPIAIIAQLLVIWSGIFMASCNQSGEHKIVNCDEDSQMIEEKITPVNNDSIDAANKNFHKSNSLKEHRVYYVDYSGSMVVGKNASVSGKNYGLKDTTLLGLTKHCLKQSIREIDGENVKIEIIPFYDSRLWNKNNIFSITKKVSFNTEELKKMNAFIDNIKVKKGAYNTHHSIAIKDFLENRIDSSGYYHVMILLTDGKDESEGVSGADIMKGEWKNHKDIYGVFVNLSNYNFNNSKEKKDKELPKCFGWNSTSQKQGNCYYKSGTDFEFKILRVPDSGVTIDNYRTCSIARIPIAGNILPEKIDLNESSKKDKFYEYKLEQYDKESSEIRIRVNNLTPEEGRPNEHPTTLKLKCKWGSEDPKNRVVPIVDDIKLTIIDIKTPNVKFDMPCVTEDLNFCKKFNGIDPEWSDTVTIKIPYEKSHDAKQKFNNLKLKVSDLPKYAELIGNKKGIYLLDKSSGTISVTIALNPSDDDLKDGLSIEGAINIEDASGLKAIYVNDSVINKPSTSAKIGFFKIETDECLHPVLIWILWILFIWLVLIGVRWLISRSGKSKFTSRIPAIRFETYPENTGMNIGYYYRESNECNELDFDCNIKCLNKRTKFVRFEFDKEKKFYEKKRFYKKNKYYKETWSILPGRIFVALKGDEYYLKLNENSFVTSIELRPTDNGNIEVYIDGNSDVKCTIEETGIKYVLANDKDNDAIQLLVEGYIPM